MSDFRMPDVNKVFLAGRLTRDPELRYIPSGMAVCKLGLAVSRFYKSKDGEKREETMFINVTTWGKTAEFVNEYLRKGRPVMVEGNLRSNDFEDKTGQKRTVIEVTAERVQQLDWGDRSGGGGAGGESGGSGSKPAPRTIEEPMPVAEEDIPF
ncbi:MAG: single-stranded DNA-binding protein [Candidatus Hydrogenedentes bacterium]|nr:single-stranded DNA-binding protein [Candidatus Hydrogenedentota bacterium]